MGVVPALPALAAASGVADFLKDFVKELASPEMIHALSPTEGFEVKPHTFQAIESEGRWKTQPDWPANDPRIFTPPAKKIGKLQKCRATILTIDFDAINNKWIEAILPLLLQAYFPSAQSLQFATTTILQGLKNNNLSPTGPLGQLLPSISRALADFRNPSHAEIDAVWWSDGYEIWAGQAAAKHVNGFGSLYGHQARVELDGVSFGNYFPQSYFLTFTGFVNPVGPTFQELRGAVLLGADGSAKGQFCESSDRDNKKGPEDVDWGGTGGYSFKY